MRLSRGPALLAVLVMLMRPDSVSGQVSLTFYKAVHTKMYIATPITCDPVGLLGIPLTPWGIAEQAAYMTFCWGTDLSFGENPPEGDHPVPLDARVLSAVAIYWQCQAGNPIPVFGSVVASNSVGGPEPLGFLGVANPVAVKDNLTVNGTFSFVSSGHPNLALEPGFQIQHLRSNTDIWHRIEGQVQCGTDAGGNPTSTIGIRFSHATRFPSHRSYWYDIVNGVDVFRGIAETIPQGAFSNLWSLPAVAPPVPTGPEKFQPLADCGSSVPLPPDPLPANYDWSNLAATWCQRMAACGYDTTGCATTYLGIVAHPIMSPVVPPPGDDTRSTTGTTKVMNCYESQEYLRGAYACPGATDVPNGALPSTLGLKVGPNPFRSSTTIGIALPVASSASIAIHDVSGRVVRRLAAESLPAGYSQFHWDGTDSQGSPVRGGMYYVSLTTSSGTQRASVVVLR